MRFNINIFKGVTVIKAGALLDSESGDVSRNVQIVIEGERIIAILE